MEARLESGARLVEVEAKSIARGSGTDPWFLGRYGANLYRGCEHGCLYCDGRAERYQVAGDFARDIQVKVNALGLLEQELGRAREPGFLFVGGGVCDAWQPAEAKYRLARGVLELALKLRFPVHVLTKSALVERDLDLLERINAERRAILSFSLASVDERLREQLEPGAAPFAERLRILEKARARGIATGIMAMPLFPGLSDQPEHLRELVSRAASAGVRFVCFAGMTLRPGVQQQTFLDAVRRDHADLLPGYQTLYRQQKSSGAPDPRYSERLYRRCREALAVQGLPGRIPGELFTGLIPSYAEVAVLLEHEDAERGEPGAKAAACWALQKWAQKKLGRLRGPRAWREVEAAFELALRSGFWRGSSGSPRRSRGGCANSPPPLTRLPVADGLTERAHWAHCSGEKPVGCSFLPWS
ncbi:MAG: radical SAM protein [Myxococcales bacterium]